MADTSSLDDVFGGIPGALARHGPGEIAVSAVLCLFLGLFAFRMRILDRKGSALAVVVGLSISLFTDLAWLCVLLLFLVTTFYVTRYKYALKKKKGLAEGKRGERGVRNVIANGLVASVIAIFATTFGMGMAGLLFITSLSVAASDSFASELGVMSKKTVLITNPRVRVRPGTEGGVSVLGMGAALLGAAIPSVLGWFLISDFALRLPVVGGWLSPFFHQMPLTPLTLLLPFLVGFLGCQVDSLLGATAQTKGRITNDEVNYISIYVGVVLVWVLGSFMM